MFLVNNLLFVLFTFTVLIGTVFPLVVEAVRGVQMSVGRPYFDRMAVPIGVALLFLMGVGPALPWGRATGDGSAARARCRRSWAPPWPLALGWFAGRARSRGRCVTIAFAGYTAQVTLARARAARCGRRMRAPGAALAQALEAQLRQGRRRLAGYVVHGAVIVIVVAIAVSSTHGPVARGAAQARRDAWSSAGYTLTFLGAEPVSGAAPRGAGGARGRRARRPRAWAC